MEEYGSLYAKAGKRGVDQLAPEPKKRERKSKELKEPEPKRKKNVPAKVGNKRKRSDVND